MYNMKHAIMLIYKYMYHWCYNSWHYKLELKFNLFVKTFNLVQLFILIKFSIIKIMFPFTVM